MAFRLDVHLDDYEYRGFRDGQGEKGPWLSLVLENPKDSRQLDVSVPRDQHAEIYKMGLQKGYHSTTSPLLSTTLVIPTSEIREYSLPAYATTSSER